MKKLVVFILKSLLILNFTIELYNNIVFGIISAILSAVPSLIILFFITKQLFKYFYSLSLILSIMLFINKFYYYEPSQNYDFTYFLIIIIIIILIYLSIVNELRFVNITKIKKLIFPIVLFISLLTYLLIYEHNKKVLLEDCIIKKAIIIEKSFKYFTYEYSINNKKYKTDLPFFNNISPNHIQIGDTILIKVSKEDNSVNRMLKELD